METPYVVVPMYPRNQVKNVEEHSDINKVVSLNLFYFYNWSLKEPLFLRDRLIKTGYSIFVHH